MKYTVGKQILSSFNLIVKVEPVVVGVDRQPGGGALAEPGIGLVAPL